MSKNTKDVTIICLTSVLNEAWFLDRFIQCASIWADHIIIGDQGSTDGSQEIAKKYEKVIFFENIRTGEMNEGDYRTPLFEKARQIEGPKILITLDADELLTPNFDSLEWQTIRSANPGTILSLQLYNLLPNGTHWVFGECYTGYVDDGASFKRGVIHAPRTIVPPGHDVLICHEIGVLHYKFMDNTRMLERNRWYQCFELVHKLSYPVSIYRRYHQLDSIPKNELLPWPDEWRKEYRKYDIEISSVLHKYNPMWNRQIIEYMIDYGAKYFRHLNIWDVNWDEKAEQLGIKHDKSFKDPRWFWEKAINRWLINTQAKQNKTTIHLIEKIITTIYR